MNEWMNEWMNKGSSTRRQALVTLFCHWSSAVATRAYPPPSPRWHFLPPQMTFLAPKKVVKVSDPRQRGPSKREFEQKRSSKISGTGPPGQSGPSRREFEQKRSSKSVIKDKGILQKGVWAKRSSNFRPGNDCPFTYILFPSSYFTLATGLHRSARHMKWVGLQVVG